VTSGNAGDWSSSAGTNANDCEWTVLPSNTWIGLGAHQIVLAAASPPPPPTPGGSVSFRPLEQINYVAGPQCTASPLHGEVVRTSGYVSAISSFGFYMQQRLTGSMFGGMFVFFAPELRSSTMLTSRAVGDEVQVVSTVMEYAGMTQLLIANSNGNGQHVTLLSAANTLVPLAVSTGTLGTGCTLSGEMHEGLLVTLSGVTITGGPNARGELVITDGSGATQLEDGLFNTDRFLMMLVGGRSALVGTTLNSVTGVVRNAGGTFEVHPRSYSDIVLSAPLVLPPLPPVSSGETVVQVAATVVTLELTLGLDVNDFGDQQRVGFSTALCAEVECFEPSCLLDLVVAPGSVSVQVRLTIPTNANFGSGGGGKGGGGGGKGNGDGGKGNGDSGKGDGESGGGKGSGAPSPSSVVATVTANVNALAAMTTAALSQALDVVVETAPTVVVDTAVSVPVVIGPPPPVPSPPPPSEPVSSPPSSTTSSSSSSDNTAVFSAALATIAFVIVMSALCIWHLWHQRTRDPTMTLRMPKGGMSSTMQMSVFNRSGDEEPRFTVTPSFSRPGSPGSPTRLNALPSEMSPSGALEPSDFTVV